MLFAKRFSLGKIAVGRNINAGFSLDRFYKESRNVRFSLQRDG